MSSVLIMSSQLSSFHPFIPASLLKTVWVLDHIAEHSSIMEGNDSVHGEYTCGTRGDIPGVSTGDNNIYHSFVIRDSEMEVRAAFHAVRTDKTSTASVL